MNGSWERWPLRERPVGGSSVGREPDGGERGGTLPTFKEKESLERRSQGMGGVNAPKANMKTRREWRSERSERRKEEEVGSVRVLIPRFAYPSRSPSASGCEFRGLRPAADP